MAKEKSVTNTNYERILRFMRSQLPPGKVCAMALKLRTVEERLNLCPKDGEIDALKIGQAGTMFDSQQAVVQKSSIIFCSMGHPPLPK